MFTFFWIRLLTTITIEVVSRFLISFVVSGYLFKSLTNPSISAIKWIGLAFFWNTFAYLILTYLYYTTYILHIVAFIITSTILFVWFFTTIFFKEKISKKEMITRSLLGTLITQFFTYFLGYFLAIAIHSTVISLYY